MARKFEAKYLQRFPLERGNFNKFPTFAVQEALLGIEQCGLSMSGSESENIALEGTINTLFCPGDEDDRDLKTAVTMDNVELDEEMRFIWCIRILSR